MQIGVIGLKENNQEEKFNIPVGYNGIYNQGVSYFIPATNFESEVNIPIKINLYIDGMLCKTETKTLTGVHKRAFRVSDANAPEFSDPDGNATITFNVQSLKSEPSSSTKVIVSGASNQTKRFNGEDLLYFKVPVTIPVESSKTFSFTVTIKEEGCPSYTRTIVSIADFIDGNANNPTYNWWNVTGENNINTLKVVSKGQYYGTWSWETLGAVVNEFEVSEKSSEIKVSVKPATALFQIIFDYFDVANGDGNGVSMYAPFCSEVFIHSKTQYDVISDFYSPTYSYSSSAAQKETYNILSDSPMETVNEGYRRNIGYRALLPQESKTFYWDILLSGKHQNSIKP